MTEDILTILLRLSPRLDVDALLREAGGRLWYLPSPKPLEWAEARDAIRKDPCTDARVVARRYRVSISTVYRAWNERMTA